MMTAALWANSNYDDDKGTRKNALEEIQANFNEAVQIIQGGGESDDGVDQQMNDNPFFAAAKEGQAKLEKPKNPDGTVREAIDYSAGIDQ